MTPARKNLKCGFGLEMRQAELLQTSSEGEGKQGSKPDKQSKRARSKLQRNRHNPKTLESNNRTLWEKQGQGQTAHNELTDKGSLLQTGTVLIYSPPLSSRTFKNHFWYPGASYCTVCDFVFTNKAELNLDLLATVCSYYLHNQQFITLQDVAY